MNRLQFRKNGYLCLQMQPKHYSLQLNLGCLEELVLLQISYTTEIDRLNRPTGHDNQLPHLCAFTGLETDLDHMIQRSYLTHSY